MLFQISTKDEEEHMGNDRTGRGLACPRESVDPLVRIIAEATPRRTRVKHCEAVCKCM